jgi:hypothetical protein
VGWLACLDGARHLARPTRSFVELLFLLFAFCFLGYKIILLTPACPGQGIYYFDFLVVLAPGKASFMPENIPSKYRLEEKDTSNYDMYIDGLKLRDINIIDFRSYFNKIKGKVKYPLFPKSGAHWNGYAISIAADTLIKHIEKSYALNLNKFVDVGGDLVFVPRKTDGEISNGMNLMIPFKGDELYYPKIKFINDKHNDKPNTLIVGDSYAETFYKFYPFYENIFGANTNYWSYNIWEKWPLNQDKENHRVVNLEMSEELLSRDLVIIIVTQINLKFLGGLFIDRQYKFFKDLDNDIDYQREVQEKKKELITQGFDNKLNIEKQARVLVNKVFFKSKEVSTKKSLKNDGAYEMDVLKTIDRIKADDNWFSSIKIQAKERGLTIDNMLERSAKHIIDNR